MSNDYYKILSVRRDASQAEIQTAYRELARKYHPDLNPDDKTAKQKFQEVQAAFDVLNDPNKREMYDRYGSDFDAMGSRGAHGAGGPGGFGSETFDFGDFFGPEASGGFADIFQQFRRPGGRQTRASKRAARGAHIEHELTVPFATAIQGGQVQLSVRRQNGKLETIEVKIPAGIEDGKKIRLRGQGETGASGSPSGDILITVRVSPHPCFQRRGTRLDVRVPVTLTEAALGAKIDVPTPEGTITLSIPPGTSSGKKLRVKGQGVKPAQGPAGDLYAEILIVLPEQLNEEDQHQLGKLGEKYQQNPRADLRW